MISSLAIRIQSLLCGLLWKIVSIIFVGAVGSQCPILNMREMFYFLQIFQLSYKVVLCFL